MPSTSSSLLSRTPFLLLILQYYIFFRGDVRRRIASNWKNFVGWLATGIEYCSFKEYCQNLAACNIIIMLSRYSPNSNSRKE